MARIADMILQDALVTVNNRKDSYGAAEQSFTGIARLWSVYLNKQISAEDVALLMCLFKIAREKNGAGKPDNLIDLCGYAALAAEVREECHA